MARILSILSIFLFIETQHATAQRSGCDCTIAPFTPPDSCFAYCSKQLLSRATESELILILGISDTIARKIELIKKKVKPAKFEDYTASLDTNETKSLQQSLKSLNRDQIYYFSLPFDERTRMAGDMRQIIRQREEREKTSG